MRWREPSKLERGRQFEAVGPGSLRRDRFVRRRDGNLQRDSHFVPRSSSLTFSAAAKTRMRFPPRILWICSFL